jgi:hypothetical protein
MSYDFGEYQEKLAETSRSVRRMEVGQAKEIFLRGVREGLFDPNGAPPDPLSAPLKAVAEAIIKALGYWSDGAKVVRAYMAAARYLGDARIADQYGNAPLRTEMLRKFMSKIRYIEKII